MSAMTIDQITRTAPVLPRPARGQIRSLRSPVLVSLPSTVPMDRPVEAVSRTPGAVADGSLQLTRRGLAVIISIFLAICVTSLTIVVAAFLAIPNQPVSGIPSGVDAGLVISSR
ncbi:MAG: hypothetical protein WAS07_05690 [Micropruina sp.]